MMSHDRLPSTGQNPERQAAINEGGLGLIQVAAGNIHNSALLNNGVLEEKTHKGDQADGVRRFATVASSETIGGWRRLSTGEGARLTVLYPADTDKSIAGSAEVELTRLDWTNGNFGPVGLPESVRVAMDGAGEVHVSGAQDGATYNVDDPNPNAMGRDYKAAEGVLERAHAAVNELVTLPPRQSSTPAVQPSAPTPGSAEAGQGSHIVLPL